MIGMRDGLLGGNGYCSDAGVNAESDSWRTRIPMTKLYIPAGGSLACCAHLCWRAVFSGVEIEEDVVMSATFRFYSL